MFGKFRAAKVRLNYTLECAQMMRAASNASQQEILDFIDDYQAYFVSCHENNVPAEDAILIVSNAVLHAHLNGEKMDNLSPLIKSKSPEVISYKAIKRYCEVLNEHEGTEHITREYDEVLLAYEKRHPS